MKILSFRCKYPVKKSHVVSTSKVSNIEIYFFLRLSLSLFTFLSLSLLISLSLSLSVFSLSFGNCKRGPHWRLLDKFNFGRAIVIYTKFQLRMKVNHHMRGPVQVQPYPATLRLLLRDISFFVYWT